MAEKTATLILSKPLEGKREFIESQVRTMIKENRTILFVLTDKNPGQAKKELLESKIFFKSIYFVDCYSMQTDGECKEEENVKYASGPLALNEISIAISEFEREFLKTETPYTIIFDSLSTLLMYSNANAIARFLQILIAKIKNFGGNVVFTMEEGMHDPKDIATIEHLMEEITEIKKEKNKVFFKEAGEDWMELKA